MTSCHSTPGMRLNGFLHPDPTSTSHRPEIDLDSLHLGSQALELDLIAELDKYHVIQFKDIRNLYKGVNEVN